MYYGESCYLTFSISGFLSLRKKKRNLLGTSLEGITLKGMGDIERSGLSSNIRDAKSEESKNDGSFHVVLMRVK